jgi:hypothetical protein
MIYTIKENMENNLSLKNKMIHLIKIIKLKLLSPY